MYLGKDNINDLKCIYKRYKIINFYLDIFNIANEICLSIYIYGFTVFWVMIFTYGPQLFKLYIYNIFNIFLHMLIMLRCEYKLLFCISVINFKFKYNAFITIFIFYTFEKFRMRIVIILILNLIIIITHYFGYTYAITLVTFLTTNII